MPSLRRHGFQFRLGHHATRSPDSPRFGITFETRVVSAHRMPDDMFAYAEAAQGRGLRAIIAGAGAQRTCQACWLRRRLCLCWVCPWRANICKVWIPCTALCKCPKGIPVATFAIGNAGAANAALFAVALLASTDEVLATKLQVFREAQTETARNMTCLRTRSFQTMCFHFAFERHVVV